MLNWQISNLKSCEGMLYTTCYLNNSNWFIINNFKILKFKSCLDINFSKITATNNSDAINCYWRTTQILRIALLSWLKSILFHSPLIFPKMWVKLLVTGMGIHFKMILPHKITHIEFILKMLTNIFILISHQLFIS